MSAGEHASHKAAAVLKFGSALSAVGAAVLLILPLVRGGAESRPRDASGALAPVVVEASDTGVREASSAFQGSILSLESQPSGATVSVNGLNQGETPVSVGLDCVPGRPVVIVFSLSGFASTTHRTPCPRDALVTVTARLKQAARGGTGKR